MAELRKVDTLLGVRSGAIIDPHQNRAANTPEAARQAARSWWSQFQKMGERESLVEGAKAGDFDSPLQGRLLLDTYPEVATEPLILGARAAEDPDLRARMLALIAGSDKPEAVNFLIQEMREGPLPESRATAAHLLRARGRAEVDDAMPQVRDSLPKK